ncbi:hypothetical protein B0H13DRAFT_2374249 [Mycena leptocephala]|nr:hypothetical protein B0H13DRAFT_2374249 [Mycena leptocephala]
MPVSITAILPFASSSPPPEPLVVSVWATDIYLPNSPIPTAHRDITRFVVSAPAPKVASSPELSPMNLPPYIPTTFLTTALSVTVPAPGTAEPATQKDDSPPGSPLTDISELDDAPTLSAPDSTKIPRPTSAARVPFSVLFPDWDSKRLDELQTYIKMLAKTHLDRTNFIGQDRQKLAEFYHLNRWALNFRFYSDMTDTGPLSTFSKHI